MLKHYYVVCFIALLSQVHSRPFCGYYSDCTNDFQNYGYSYCGWGSPAFAQPKYGMLVMHCALIAQNKKFFAVLMCPASRTAINCGMLPEAQACTTDNDCGYGQKCCEDGCFIDRICKAGFYVEARPKTTSTTEFFIEEVDLE